MSPIIGVTPSMREEQTLAVHRANTDVLIQAGGTPVILPYTNRSDVLSRLADGMDGLLLTGGGDIDPTLFGEEPLPGLREIIPERDHMEIALSRRLLEEDKPILALCRGCQILNIAAGGDMYQDLSRQCSDILQHEQRSPRSHPSHTVTVEKGSLLYRLTEKRQYKVNSFHHQAVRRLAPGFEATAVTRDGVIEAFESRHHTFVLGVQWHPEHMAETDAVTRGLFEAFVQACGQRERK